MGGERWEVGLSGPHPDQQKLEREGAQTCGASGPRVSFFSPHLLLIGCCSPPPPPPLCSTTQYYSASFMGSYALQFACGPTLP